MGFTKSKISMGNGPPMHIIVDEKGSVWFMTQTESEIEPNMARLIAQRNLKSAAADNQVRKK